MSEDDFDAFGDMLDAVCGLLSKGAYVPSPQNTALFFRALARQSIEEVRAGFDRHVADLQRGRFVPLPADILAQIEILAADDGRPGPEEAWAIALQSVDENATVVWTREIAEAWGVARVVLDAGDEVGARMAFREIYGRLVDAARKVRVPVAWTESIGFDPGHREIALANAVDAGRLVPAGQALLDAPEAPIGLLELSQAAGAPPHVLEAFRSLREALVARASEPGADARERARTAELKSEAAVEVASDVEPSEILRRVRAGLPARVVAGHDDGAQA